MLLSNLLQGVALASALPVQDVEITSLSYDTRTMAPGALFFALSGYKTDGHHFIEKAMALGAAAVLCQAPPPGADRCIAVDDPRRALAIASGNWFGHPGDEMELLAVTGTNGKTTTTYLLKAVLERVLQTKVGLLGTNQNMIDQRVLPAHRTTPESYELQGLLRAMADGGCTHVVMEASSHALALARTWGLHFRAGIFTNLTPDHMDFHPTMEDYRSAKGLLFDQCQVAVLNLDDGAGRHYQKTVPCPVYTYSENKTTADLTAKNLRLYPQRVEFEVMSMDALCRCVVPIPGGFSVYNALGVLACTTALGLPLEDCVAALGQASGVRGRVEVVQADAPFTILIDYAHTPDALENILATVRDFAPGRVILLFGCGGDRDRSKRPVMGAIAGRLADLCIVTSDNPRTEPPMAIIEEILAGFPPNARKRIVEVDRRRAIQLALGAAKEGDVVVLAGKGHETNQETMGETTHLDEREEIAAYFAGRIDKGK